MSAPDDTGAEGQAGFSIDDGWWGMAMIAPDGVVKEANQPFAEMLGLTPEDLVGRSIVEIMGEDHLGPELESAQRLLAGETPVVTYQRVVDFAGGGPWRGTVLMSLLRDDQGEPHTIHVRVSEQEGRRPPDRIAWREGDFPLALDAMKVGVAIIGLDGVALKVNQALCEILGRTEEEIRRTDLLSLTHPDDRTPDVTLGTRAWLGEIDSYGLEKRILQPDGTVRWVQQELTFARDEDGQPVQLVGQVIDISDRKAIELELERSRQELRDLIEHMPVGLLSSGPDGRIVAANQAAADIAGVPVMARGFDVTTVIHPDDLGRISAITTTHAIEGDDYHIEFRVVRPDGTIRWVRNDARPELDYEGNLLGITGTWLDVTDLKAAEEKLRRQATHDALTGLANRHLFFEALAVSIERCTSAGVELSVLFVDLDGFKAVNDAHGHGVGDQVLRQVAARIASAADVDDVVARFGGDEFIVRCERRSGDVDLSPPAMAERIITAVGRPYEVDGLHVTLGASVGISTWTPGASADVLVNAADRAVYLAKAAGRNCWRHS